MIKSRDQNCTSYDKIARQKLYLDVETTPMHIGIWSILTIKDEEIEKKSSIMFFQFKIYKRN